jgi:hypothetical protein
VTEPNKPEGDPPKDDQADRKRREEDAAEGAGSDESDRDEDRGAGAEPGEARTEEERAAAAEEGEPAPSETLAAEEPAVIGEREDEASARRPDDAEADEAEAAADEERRPGAPEDAAADADRLDDGAPESVRQADSEAGTAETQEQASAAGAPAEQSGLPPGAAPGDRVVVERRGGLIPGLVGGVIAVAGFLFAAPYILPEGMRPVTSLAPVESRIETQAERIETLAAQVGEATAALEARPSQDDLAGIGERIDAVQADLEARLAELSNAIADLEQRDEELIARIDEAERAPLEDATDPEVVAALESYSREVESLRAEVESQTQANRRLIEEAAAATAEAQAAAEAEAEAAAARAEMVARQQALVDVQEALDAGAPFAEPLSRLSDMDVPEALSSVAEEGVPTLAALQADFAAPAREALEAARRSAPGGEAGDRVLTFLQTQLGIRSLEPKDGDSADAILSRAQAAAREGDLMRAVEELRNLPEPALSEMQTWIDRAMSRAEATAAADALAASIATN